MGELTRGTVKVLWIRDCINCHQINLQQNLWLLLVGQYHLWLRTLSCHLFLAAIVQSFLSSCRYYYTYSAFVSSGLDHYNALCRMLLAVAIWKMKPDIQYTAACLFSSISYCKYLTQLPYRLSKLLVGGIYTKLCIHIESCWKSPELQSGVHLGNVSVKAGCEIFPSPSCDHLQRSIHTSCWGTWAQPLATDLTSKLTLSQLAVTSPATVNTCHQALPSLLAQKGWCPLIEDSSVCCFSPCSMHSLMPQRP